MDCLNIFDDEVFVDINGYNGMYMISNLGRVLSYKKRIPIYLKNILGKDGYERIYLTKNKKDRYTHSIHRLIAEHFIPNHEPDKYYFVDHINVNPSDNRIENLRWSNHHLNGLNVKCKGSLKAKHQWYENGKPMRKSFNTEEEVIKNYNKIGRGSISFSVDMRILNKKTNEVKRLQKSFKTYKEAQAFRLANQR